ncbi:MAG: non-heme iron oxygenase ferredoxin subunit [Gammaproteobacteria bacterium]
MSAWVDVDSAEEFGPGESRLVDVDDVMIAVFNLDGAYFAIEDICSHDGSPLLGSGLEPEALIEGDEITCPRHGARFCIKTGAALCPPAYEATNTFPTRVENGTVQVRDNR